MVGGSRLQAGIPGPGFDEAVLINLRVGQSGVGPPSRFKRLQGVASADRGVQFLGLRLASRRAADIVAGDQGATSVDVVPGVADLCVQEDGAPFRGRVGAGVVGRDARRCIQPGLVDVGVGASHRHTDAQALPEARVCADGDAHCVEVMAGVGAIALLVA
ncbi:hypothetical protein D3C86_783590 [compost metagenome]